MIFNFRKIASAAASVAMLGSTVGLALAANYPAPYVNNGATDVAVVYGSNLDISAVTEITSSLSTELAAQSSGGTGTPTGGDYVLLAKTSNKINLDNEISSVFGTTINDDDLPTLLKDGTYYNDENTAFKYEQKITLANNFLLSFFADNDYKDQEPTVGIRLNNSLDVFNYTLDFTDNAESDVSGGDLVDLETTDIEILGRNYFIFDADNATSKLTLLDSATSGIVNEGETITVGGHAVSINFISSTAVKLDVDGEVTNSMAIGETYKLADDTYVGVKEINKLEVAGELGNVEFSLGSGKLELPNNDNIELNDVQVNEIKSVIARGTTTGGKETVDKITLNWKTDDDEFITPDSSLTMPGFEVVKFSMNDFIIPAEETLDIKDSGTTRMVLDVNLEKGRVTIPLFYTNTTGDFNGLGDDSNELTVTNAYRAVVFNKTRNDGYMIVSWNSTTDAETYVVRATSWDTNGANNRTDIEVLTEGGAWTTVDSNVKAGDQVDIGSATLTVASVSKDKAVNFTASDTGVTFHKLFTKEGLFLLMPYVPTTSNTNEYGAINFTNVTAGHGYNTYDLRFVEEDKDDNLASGTNFTVVLGQNSDNEPQVASYTTATEQFKEIEDDNNIVSRVKSDVGTKVRRIGSSSDQREVEITYSGSESYGEVFLSDISASSTGGELGSVSVMDTELATSGMQTKNLIVVGGTCVNTAASSVLGLSGAACGPSWTDATGVSAGEYLIQTFTNPWSSSKVATLVAGYEQGDTVNAATYFTTQNVDTTAGTKLIGTTGTSATVVTA